MVARCAGGSPGSGEEEEVSLKLAEVCFYHWKGKNCLCDYTSSVSAKLDKWCSGPFISPGYCDLLDDAWRDASSLLELNPVLKLGLMGHCTAWAVLKLSE